MLHWTAGRHVASDYERTRYHLLIEDHGDRTRLVEGVPIERNMRLSLSGPAYHQNPEVGYAAHTGGLNARAIGLAMCGMRGAADHRPGGVVDPGPEPITVRQVRAMLSTTASLCRAYDLEPIPTMVLGHHEVLERFGVGVRKWDVSWLPGLGVAAEEVGPFLREQVRLWLASEPIDDRLYAPPVGATSEEVLEGDDG